MNRKTLSISAEILTNKELTINQIGLLCVLLYRVANEGFVVTADSVHNTTAHSLGWLYTKNTLEKFEHLGFAECNAEGVYRLFTHSQGV
jgi:hypothetical protein